MTHRKSVAIVCKPPYTQRVMETISAGDKINEPVVNVLLSIFKPNFQWLSEQIQSVEKQIDVDVSLNFRNDGSTNVAIPTNRNVFILDSGEHLGAGASYLELLANSNSGGIAFCDQDDLWHESKLTMQVSALSSIKLPAISYCDFEVVNSNLKLIKVKRTPKHVTKFTFLFRNNIPGFSIYLNDQAREFLKDSKSYLPKDGFHDWWVLLAISQVGICRRVPQVLASYRLHGSNVIGVSVTIWNRLKRIKRRMNVGFSESKQLIHQMIKYLEYAENENHGSEFLNKIVEGMTMNRWKRLQLLIREGILKSPFSEIVTVTFLYIIPRRLTL